jgi:capsular exopolysaccharide synthesis family protein
MSEDFETGSEVDHLRLLRRIMSHWRLIISFFVAVTLPVSVWSLVFAPKTYEAVAKIFIEDPRRVGPGFMRDWMPASDASFQVALLRSRSLAVAVAESLSRESLDELLKRAMYQDYFSDALNLIRGLFGHESAVYSPQQRAVTELQAARVTLTSLPSGEVEIRTVAYHPRVAMDLANTYIEVLQTRSRSNIRDEARATREFIEGLLNQTRASLQESEEKLAKLQRGRPSTRFSERTVLELTRGAEVAQLENSLADIQATKEIAKARLNFLRGGKGGKPLPPAAQDLLTKRLVQLREKLAGLQERYTDGHPLVKATQAEIKDVQAMLAGNPQPLLNAGATEQAALAKQMMDTELEIASLETKEGVVKQSIARLAQNLSSLNTEEMEVSKLLRKVEAQRNLYTTLSEKLGTVRAQEQGEDRGLRVIDLATLPQSPSGARARKITLLGAVLGLSLGVGVAAVIEYFKQPMDTEDDVAAATGLPALGWLPTIKGNHADRGPDREPLSFVDSATIPDTLPMEACRSVRISLQSLSHEREIRTIMLASAGPGEGKSTVALNLAWAFWEAGRRLILVDADLRRPSLHRPFRYAPRPGLADLLTSDVPLEQVVQPVKERFDLLAAGSATGSQPGVLLSAEKVRRVLDLVNDRADLVLFDSAPVLAVADNLVLASMVDGVILVVRAGSTQRRDLVRAKSLLEKVGAPLVGIVLNRVSPWETRRYYQSYASYYGVGNGRPARKRWRSPRSWWPTVRQGSEDLR